MAEKTNKFKKWFIFGITMVCALSIGSYSLVKKDPSCEGANSSCCPGEVKKCQCGGEGKGSLNCPDDKEKCKDHVDGKECTCVSKKTNSEEINICKTNLSSIEELNKLGNEKNVVFVYLPGDNGDKNKTSLEKITNYIKSIKENQENIATYTMSKEANGYNQLIKNLTVTSFPSVVVLGKGCKSLSVSEMTDEKLASAYKVATTPIKSACGSACGPH